MNHKVATLLNEQINKEFYSAYLYLDIANFYTRKGLMVLQTGMKFRQKKNKITQCSCIAICKITA